VGKVVSACVGRPYTFNTRDITPFPFNRVSGVDSGEGEISFDDEIQQLKWIPTQVGTWKLTITNSINAFNLIDLEVTVSKCNEAPSINFIQNQEVNQGEVLSIQLSGNDPDGGELTYSCTSCPEGASVTPDGVFTFNTKDIEPASYSVVAQVSDNQQDASTSFVVNVIPKKSADSTIWIIAGIIAGILILLLAAELIFETVIISGLLASIGVTMLGGLLIVFGVIAAIAVILTFIIP